MMQSTLVTDRDSYMKARGTYSDLHGLLDSLSEKLSDVSGNVDKEFLSAYRVHMLAIQSEMKDLTDEVNRGVQALNSDGNVAKLEQEVKWFVDESTRLRQHVTSMDKDCQQMLARLKAMNEQKIYLNEQLKAIMKRNRVLHAEIDYARQYAKPHTVLEGTVNAGEGNAGGGFDSTAELDRQAGSDSDLDSPVILSQYNWTEQDQSTSFPQLKMRQKGSDNTRQISSGLLKEGLDDRPGSNNSTGDSPGQQYQEQLRRQASSRPLSSESFVPSPRRIGSSGSPKKRSSAKNISEAFFGNDSIGAAPSVLMQQPGGSVSSSVLNRNIVTSSDGGGGSLVSPSSKTKLLQKKLGSWGTATHHHVNYPHSSGSFDGSGSGNIADKYRKQGEPPIVPANNIAVSHVIGARAQSPPPPAGPGGVEGFEAVPVYQQSVPRIVPRMQSPIRSGSASASGGNRQPQQQQQQRIDSGDRNNRSERKAAGSARRNELKIFLRRKSPSELVLEKTIADAFLQIRSRKLVAAKRGAVKRYAVSMTGRDDVDVDQGTPLLDGGNRNNNSNNNTVAVGAGNDTEEDDLLRRPLIEQSGGISGLGLKQFSENDRFSSMVKFLLNRNQFEEVVRMLQLSLS